MNHEQSLILRRAVEFAVREAAWEAQSKDTRQVLSENKAGRWYQGAWGQIPMGLARSISDRITGAGDWDGREYVAIPPLSCGTSFCIAGNITQMAGAKFVLPTDYLTSSYGDDEEVSVDYCVPAGSDTIRGIEDYALEVLGFDDIDDMNGLFGGSNRLRDVVTYANEMLARYEHEQIEVDFEALKVLNPVPRANVPTKVEANA